MRTARRILLPLLAAAVLASCGDPVPKLPRLEAGAVVLAFGDSLTHGTGASPEQSYPAVLERRISRRTVGSGVPGETSEEGLARLPEVIDEVKPQLLILCHGGNDFLRKLDEGAAEKNLRAMVGLARQRGIAVVLLATPKPGFGVSMPKFYAQLGKDFGIPVESQVLADVLTTNRLKSDLVHPNAEGYAAVADALAKLLGKAGAL
jgi:lysophospholipase L1-like esterase